MMNDDPFASIQAATRAHRKTHGCGAYTFEDGPGLVKISAEAQPTRILELGTALGYTACCLASGSPTATVDTVEGDPIHVRVAREQIAAVGLEDRITVHNGDFEKTLASLADTYDLIFFDGFAPNATILSLLRSKLNSNGTLVCANIGLADTNQRMMILAELSNEDYWQAMGSIETGQTIVAKKK